MKYQLKARQWLMAFTTLLAMFVALNGCGLRHQTSDDGTAETSFYFGLATEEKCAPNRTTLVRAYNVGVWKNETGGGIGFRRARYACVSNRCQAIFWVDEDIDAEKLRAQLGNPSNLCVLKR